MASTSTDPSSSSPSIPHTKKDGSHAAFYAGFLKGAVSAIDGMVLFIRTPSLRSIFRELIVPLCNAQAAYFLIFTLLFFMLSKGQSQTISEFLHSLSRWGRTLTIVLSFVLDKHKVANANMFYSALRIRSKNSAFASELESSSNEKIPFRVRLLSAKRLIKLGIFKSAATIIKYIVPGGEFIAVPMVSFISMFPVLGAPVAGVVSAIHLLPTELLQSSSVDDFLLSFGESVVDADECGQDLLKRYVRKMTPEVRDYFCERYRGYIVGCGFIYSFLSAIPFLGIPVALISECGAACLIADITKRNLHKRDHVQLPGEEHVKEEERLKST